MADTNFVLIACALSALVACAVAIGISYFIMKTRVAKKEDVFMQKIRAVNDIVSKLGDDMIDVAGKTDEAKAQCEALKKEFDEKAAQTDKYVDEMRSSLEIVLQKAEKAEIKFADINDRLNVLDSTVKNIDRMRDFEINGEESPYFFDDDEYNENESVKDKFVSGAQKMANFVSDLSIDAIAGTAFGIVNAVKKHFNKN